MSAKRIILRIADVFLLPFVCVGAVLLWGVRRAGVGRIPLCRNALIRIGVFPITRHYYEPQFDHRRPKRPFSEERELPGIDWNIPGQLEMLARFQYAEELAGIPMHRADGAEFHFNNGFFESGDAEYWYQLIRTVKPKRIIEIGSGFSTMMAMRALRKNREISAGHQCEHICVEPYEQRWLEKSGARVIRQRVEDIQPDWLLELDENDVLFIDSSHIIRPEGDVLFEYLQLLPRLRRGVIVHVHDIFSPRNYLSQWLREDVWFWNEQYLLEAFLTQNPSWKVLGAVNLLHHRQYDELKRVAPYLTPEREPGSFYIQRI